MNVCARKQYPSDLTDDQWSLLEPIVLAFEDRVRPGPGREVDLREVVNALLYQNRTGCQWAFLPHDLLPKSTVYDYFAKWRDRGLFRKIVDVLRTQVRESTPTAAERERFVKHLSSDAKMTPQLVEDAIWALISCSEFRFNQ